VFTAFFVGAVLAFGVNFLSRWANTLAVADATALAAIIPLTLVAYPTWLTDKGAPVIWRMITLILLFAKRDGRVRLRATSYLSVATGISTIVAIGRLGREPRMRRAWHESIILLPSVLARFCGGWESIA